MTRKREGALIHINARRNLYFLLHHYFRPAPAPARPEYKIRAKNSSTRTKILSYLMHEQRSEKGTRTYSNSHNSRTLHWIHFPIAPTLLFVNAMAAVAAAGATKIPLYLPMYLSGARVYKMATARIKYILQLRALGLELWRPPRCCCTSGPIRSWVASILSCALSGRFTVLWTYMHALSARIYILMYLRHTICVNGPRSFFIRDDDSSCAYTLQTQWTSKMTLPVAVAWYNNIFLCWYIRLLDSKIGVVVF